VTWSYGKPFLGLFSQKYFSALLVSATVDVMKKEKVQISSEKKSPRPYKDVKQLYLVEFFFNFSL
jgi:hypothetical protein